MLILGAVQMRTLANLLFPPLIAAFACVSAWVVLHRAAPAFPATIAWLLARHPCAVGGWLALAAIGCDYAFTAARDSIGYRNVGQKSRAQFALGGGR